MYDIAIAMSCIYVANTDSNKTIHVHKVVSTAVMSKKATRIIIDLRRFNKIAIRGKGPDGKWTRKPMAYREFNNC